MSQPIDTAIEVFFSYSHKDEALRDAVAAHLTMLKREGVIQAWHDRAISAGSEWAQAIDQHMEAAELILLLISANFLSSDYCWDVELKRAMERHEAGAACVIPIILKPCDWASAPFGKLQALPKNAKPVTQWSDRDEALLNVARGIRHAVKKLATSHEERQVTAPLQPTAQAVIPEQPSVGLWMHGWEKHTYNGTPTIELDWTDYFCKSPWRFPDEAVLEQALLPQFKQLHDQWAKADPNKLIELRSTLPLTLMLALGKQFPQVGRWRFQVEQSPDPVLWCSKAPDAPPSQRRLLVREQLGEGRKNVLIALGMINQKKTLNGAKQLIDRSPTGFFESFIYAEPEGSERMTNADAIALASQAKQMMQHCDALNIHLVIASPAAFCLFLGQQLNALGEVQTYEWHTDQQYVPSLKLRT